MRTFLVALLLLQAWPAAAHTGADALVTGATWTYDPWLIVPLYAVGITYLAGTVRLWRAAGFGRGVTAGQAAAFWGGTRALALAGGSPRHWLCAHLFAAHLIEHEVLMVVAAPLLAYARPNGAIVWSLPVRLRPAGRVTGWAPVLAVWALLGHPVTATALHGAALWLWHAPVLYTLALSNEAAHRLEHLSFFFTAYLFWWTLFHGRGPGRGERVRDVIAIGCLFVTILHSGLLAALLTLSPHVLYPAQVRFSVGFGLTPLEDQQLAGVLMWVPMGAVYTAAALFFAHRLLTLRAPLAA
jgi:cytochrome c oxidase assembly factor CtaG